MYISNNLLRQLSLELARRIVGLSGGRHLGNRIGPSTVFRGIRPWAPGDGARSIDHRASARDGTGQLHTRVFTQQPVVNGLVVVDTAPRLYWGGNEALALKSFLIRFVADALAQILLLQGDSVGCMAAFGGDLAFSGIRKNNERAIGDILEREEPGLPDGLDLCLQQVPHVTPSPNLVIVVSDFLNEGWREPFERLVRADREIIAVQVLDPWDLVAPALRGQRVVGGRRVDFGNRQFREAYNAMAAARQHGVTTVFERLRVHHWILQTPEDLFDQLVEALLRPSTQRNS